MVIIAATVAAASDVAIREGANGKTISVHAGQVVEVSLPSNPTTGYQWAVRGDPAPLVLVKSDFVAAQSDGRMGAGGTQKLRFKAAAAGTSEIVLDYKRPWEKDTPPAKTFTVKIEVQ